MTPPCIRKVQHRTTTSAEKKKQSGRTKSLLPLLYIRKHAQTIQAACGGGGPPPIATGKNTHLKLLSLPPRCLETCFSCSKETLSDSDPNNHAVNETRRLKTQACENSRFPPADPQTLRKRRQTASCQGVPHSNRTSYIATTMVSNTVGDTR